MSLIKALTVWLVVFGAVHAQPAQSLSERATESMRNRIEAAGSPPRIDVGEESIYASRFLPLFYQQRLYQLAWSNDEGPLPPAVRLLQALRGADREGLDPSAYHLGRIASLMRDVQIGSRTGQTLNPLRLVDLDLLLTDAFLIYASHLVSGRVNPTTLDSEWHVVESREVDFPALLERVVASGRISDGLEGLLPTNGGYAMLKEALSRYRGTARDTDWPMVPDGPKLQLDDADDRVEVLRRLLLATGDLEKSTSEAPIRFDAIVEEAVKRFQRRHGLDTDGVVGKTTLAALNVPVEERIRQIELNLERWRWLPRELGARHILVNIPRFELEVVDGGNVVLRIRAVVGRPYRRTPVFSASMTYLVFNPYWHVPPSIAVADILPSVQKDRNYLAKKNIKVFRGWGSEAEEIDPATIDWPTLAREGFPFRFRQEPGPENALGVVKFMFPNRFNVYLHDTPSRELFTRAERTFSSGCIRIEKPLELAEYLLREDSGWSAEGVLAVSRSGVEQTVRLPRSIPVHLLYWTCWVDAEGIVHFRNDIYGRDRLLDGALSEKPPVGD